jgi:hypothetical protein
LRSGDIKEFGKSVWQEEIAMTIQTTSVQPTTNAELDGAAMLLFSLLGLTVSLALLPLFGAEFATVLSLAGWAEAAA